MKKTPNSQFEDTRLRTPVLVVLCPHRGSQREESSTPPPEEGQGYNSSLLQLSPPQKK